MRKMNMKTSLAWTVILSSLVLSACGSSFNEKKYKVTLTNVTADQPLSPATVIFHKSAYHLFQPGQMASVALEHLAEGGSNQELFDEANANAAFVTSASGAGIIPPGGSETIDLEVDDTTDLNISVAAMLVNTNDAFAARGSNKIASLKKGESFSLHVPIWDAGTEANTEASGSMPGPADGGEGFNASRSGDANFVAIHQGVVTNADGLATSVLGESHRFNNPGVLLHVERVK